MNLENVIEVEDIYKSFGTKHILTGVNFDVRKGEVLVVIGKSGSGKSVIFKHLTGILKPDRGKIILEGRDLNSLDERELFEARKKFGVAFQLSALFDSLNVFENVSFGLRRMNLADPLPDSKIRERVRDSLALVGLKDMEKKMPADLSGGMQKRVSIARAICYEPEIILYDEPTTGLDPITVAAVDDLIISLNKKLSITSIVVSHDMESVFKIAHRITMLYEGEMIMTALADEFKTTDNPVVKQFVAGTQEGPINVV